MPIWNWQQLEYRVKPLKIIELIRHVLPQEYADRFVDTVPPCRMNTLFEAPAILHDCAEWPAVKRASFHLWAYMPNNLASTPEGAEFWDQVYQHLHTNKATPLPDLPTPMKTIEVWLGELPPGYRQLALANLDGEYRSVLRESLEKAVLSAFDWDPSPEGWGFWSAVWCHCRSGDVLPKIEGKALEHLYHILLDELPAEYAKLAKERLNPDYPFYKVLIDRSNLGPAPALMDAFCWSATPEGDDFWQQVKDCAVGKSSKWPKIPDARIEKIKELLKPALPERYYQAAVANMEKLGVHVPAKHINPTNAREAFNAAFTGANTPEGFEFWRRVHTHLESGSPLPLFPDDTAEGHNPDKLTNKQVEVADGWRLLTEDELYLRASDDPAIECWEKEHPAWGNNSGRGYRGFSPVNTYRTQKPAGYFLAKPKEPTNREKAEKLVRESGLPEEYKTLILERIDESPGGDSVRSLSHLLSLGLSWCDTPEGDIFWRDLWHYIYPSSGPSVLPLIPGSPVDLRVKAIKEQLQKLPEPYRTQALSQVDPHFANDWREARGFGTPALALQAAFAWSRSPQKYDYWKDLFTKLAAGEAQKPAKPKTLRPWAGAHEVPMPCAFRAKGYEQGSRFAAAHADGHGVHMGAHDPSDDCEECGYHGWPQHTYQELLDGFEVTVDGGKTWSPCGVYDA